MELGYGKGEVAARIVTDDLLPALHLPGPAVAPLSVQRRLQGWLSAHVVRGLVVVLPDARQDGPSNSQLAYLLVKLGDLAIQTGTPTVFLDTRSCEAREADAAWQALAVMPSARAKLVSCCTLPSRGRHHDVLATGFFCGMPWSDGGACPHSSRSPPPRTPWHWFGAELATRAADWLRQGADRLADAALWKLLH